MAIRVICKNCGSKIDAKEELLGLTRHCPKCKSAILIVPESGNVTESNTVAYISSIETDTTSANSNAEHDATVSAQPADENQIMYDNNERLPTHDPPTKLSPNCRYFIFAHDRMLAAWEIGKGWQYNTVNGFVNAKINKDLLPTAGTFKFVEMIIEQLDTGKQLTGIRTFSLSGKWAIPAIAREPEEILVKINGQSVMTKPQRQQLLAFIRKNYMPDFLQNAQNVYEFLICDFTSESDVFVS